MKKVEIPNDQHYALYYQQYMDKVIKDGTVLQQLKNNAASNILLLKSLSEEQLQFRYSPEKWCIKDIFQHLIDVEKLMYFRAMVFVRGDKTPQLWIDDDKFASEAMAHKKPLSKLIVEYKAQRAASLAFFKNCSAKEFKRYGIASQFPMSVAATLYIICGHELHHFGVIKEKYLK